MMTMRVYTAWCLPVYLYGVVFMCRLTGKLPDSSRVEWWIARAVKVKLERG